MAGAQELFWRECYALAAENYSFGQESQPNGLILLIQPTGLHTAALSFTAREEDSLKEGEKKEKWRGGKLGVFGLDWPQRTKGSFSLPKKSSHLRHLTLFWAVFGLRVITQNPSQLSLIDWVCMSENYNQDDDLFRPL